MGVQLARLANDRVAEGAPGLVQAPQAEQSAGLDEPGSRCVAAARQRTRRTSFGACHVTEISELVALFRPPE